MPCHCPPPGCYPPVVENWEITNEWTGRSARVSSRLQPPQWPQHVWDTAMLHTGVPQYALDEFRRLSRPGRRSICDRGKSRSRSRSRGRYREIDRIHEGEYKNHVPSKQDFSFKRVEKEKEPSKKELKSVLKHQDSRLFFDISMGPHYGFNTCSDHPIIYDRLKFPTAEHLLSYFMVSQSLPSICRGEASPKRKACLACGTARDLPPSLQTADCREPLGGSEAVCGQEIGRLETRSIPPRSQLSQYSSGDLEADTCDRWKWYCGTSSRNTRASEGYFSVPGSDR